jgi:CMP/dCMP kinase
VAISIAIDGPAGAGKSTIAKRIAKLKNYSYIDTGAMYRACALKAIQMGISCKDSVSVARMLQNTEIQIGFINSEQQVVCDGKNVTDLIRTPEVSKGASDISAIKEVRMRMVEIQREMAKKTDSVLDGRDIGTFVLPHAKHKIFLTASVEERAKRRYREMMVTSGNSISFIDVKKDIEYRDYHDSIREIAPLKKAEDAIEIDTTYMSIDQVVAEIIAILDKNA